MMRRRYTIGFLAALALALACAPSALAGERTYKLRFGPISLNGYQVRQNSDPVRTPKVNGYITHMRAHVVDKRGRDIPIQRVMLHHVLFTNRGRFDGDRHDGTCPGIPRERFMGTGEEHQVLDLPAGYGIPIHAGDRWMAAWMLMNHRQKRDSGYIEYDVTVETAKKLTPVKAYWLDVTNCRGHVYYNVPGGGAPGSTNHNRVVWRPPFDGRLVAGGAHLHGGTKSMKVYQPRCQNRKIVDSKPLYGMPDDPVYQVLPVLHEPGPINTSWFESASGIPVRKGEKLVVSGDYDGELPHVKVMAVMHVYMARASDVPAACAPMPSDLTNENISVPGRGQAPVVTVPLTGIGPNGKAQTIEDVPGKTKVLQGDGRVLVHDFSYSVSKLSIPLGASITWRFPDTTSHDVTLANGPYGFSSPFSRVGRTYTQRFTRPGKYRLFCSLHPVVMHEIVDVRDPGSGGAQARGRASGSGGGWGSGGSGGGSTQVHW
jgi:plastocyanin